MKRFAHYYWEPPEYWYPGFGFNYHRCYTIWFVMDCFGNAVESNPPIDIDYFGGEH